MSSTKANVSTIVTAIWRGESRLLGTDYLGSAIDAVQSGESQGNFVKRIGAEGDNFDLQASAEIIFQAIILTNAIISIVKNLRDELGRRPTASETKHRVEADDVMSDVDNPAVTDELDTVIDKAIEKTKE